MLEVKNLKKSFDNNKVLKGIDFKVNKGDIVAIIGPSGCGKSTFLRCLNMIERPTGGKVIFEGYDLTAGNVNLPKIREKIGMVFQQFNLFPHLTVIQNITLAPIKPSCLNMYWMIRRQVRLPEKYWYVKEHNILIPNKPTATSVLLVMLICTLSRNWKFMRMT